MSKRGRKSNPGNAKAYYDGEPLMPRADTDRLFDMLNEALRDYSHKGLDETVADYRAGDNPTSWSQIAHNIQTMTDISVSGEWLRLRYGK